MTEIAVEGNGERMLAMVAPEVAGAQIRLRIFDRIDPGFGVVPILASEPFVFQMGEVAVYKEERAFEFTPGLYCLERQQPVAHSPHPDSRRIVDRRVVYLHRSSRGTAPDNWEYLELDTKVIAGTRRHRSPEGPFYQWALNEMLLGPVIGIYAPGSLRAD